MNRIPSKRVKLTQKGRKRNLKLQDNCKARKQNPILRTMAAKKKSEAAKRGGQTKTEDQKLTYKRHLVNLGKTDYNDLMDFEKENGISTSSEAIRKLLRDGLKLWKSNRDQGLRNK